MSKATKARPTKPTEPVKTAASPTALTAARPRETWRDSIESILVAFILALVIRGFDAEAFVIPTGSMAPTLMGRHKEITCPQCGAVYSLNANDETRTQLDANGQPRGIRITYGTCSNCRYRAKVDEQPTFNGDRILVMKFPYDLPWLPGAAKPKRWDVVVFHYPEQPEQNYIKRLVGLPNEELMIRSGDIWTRTLGTDDPFVIQRKPAYKLKRILIPVYDDRNRPKALEGMSEWLRWQSDDPAAWQASTSDPDQLTSTFVVQPKAAQVAWLTYRHLLPDPWQWEAILDGSTPTPPRPSLVDDYYSYNSSQVNPRTVATSEPHWVGDLQVDFLYEGTDAKELIVELIEGGVPHRATIDLATGKATLSRGDNDLRAVTVDTPARAASAHAVAFANIDDALTLSVDGRVMGSPYEYELDPAKPLVPTEADLQPVRVGVSGGTATIKDLLVKRDIHYTLQPNQSDYQRYGSLDRNPNAYRDVRDILSTPARFPELAQLDQPGLYKIRPKHYMMLGDNSPRSRDSRAWEQLDTEGGRYWDDAGNFWSTDPWSNRERAAHEVPEDLVTGRAFFVYWPHGVPFGPWKWNVNPDFQLPFRPYVERMKPIR